LTATGVLDGAPPPLVIAGVGGSGTRVFARIAMDAGVYMADHRNQSEDALDLWEFGHRWLQRYAASSGRLSPADQTAIAADLSSTLVAYRRDIDDPLRPWGWKQPRSIHYVPLFDELLPGMRFMHVIRDGRDVAFGKIMPLVWAADAYLGPDRVEEPLQLRQMRFWARVNEEAADYGERILGDRYLRVRFEDLCGAARPTIAALASFAVGREVEISEQMLAQVQPPDTIGRWRERRSDLAERVEREGAAGLSRFGYL
jgi:Sulfotransferase family